MAKKFGRRLSGLVGVSPTPEPTPPTPEYKSPWTLPKVSDRDVEKALDALRPQLTAAKQSSVGQKRKASVNSSGARKRQQVDYRMSGALPDDLDDDMLPH